MVCEDGALGEAPADADLGTQVVYWDDAIGR